MKWVLFSVYAVILPIVSFAIGWTMAAGRWPWRRRR